MSTFPMRSSLRSGQPQLFAAAQAPNRGTALDRATEPALSCDLVGQESDRTGCPTLNPNHFRLSATGLQNLYSAVRSRPAPPTTSHPFSRLSGRSKGTTRPQTRRRETEARERVGQKSDKLIAELRFPEVAAQVLRAHVLYARKLFISQRSSQ